MQKNKNLIRNIGIALLNIFMIVSLVLVLILKNDYGYNLYWVITPFLMVLVLMVISRWSVRGLNVDRNESIVIQRSFDDTTVISTVIFGIIYLTIQFIDYIKHGLINNSIVIIIFFVVMVAYELITYLAIHVAKRDTARLLEKIYNKGPEINGLNDILYVYKNDNIEKDYGINDLKIYVQRTESSISSKIKVEYTFIGRQLDDEFYRMISTYTNRPPLSKYGIIPTFKCGIDLSMLNIEIYMYSKTNSHSYLRDCNYMDSKVKLISPIKVDLYEKDFE